MKIGILTYHRAHNYGAMLQAYALLTFLRDKGHNVELIDYWPEEHRIQYALIKPIVGNNCVNRLKSFVVNTLTFISRYRRIRKFNLFENKFLNLGKTIRYTTFDKKIIESYDCVIVGSDQIWRNVDSNGKYLGFDPIYFGQNIPQEVRCISYAASMGVIQLTDDDKNILTQYLSRFSRILVRENSLRNTLNELGFESDVVLDPTLLLSKEQWNKLLPIRRFRKEKYVLYYELMPSKEALTFAKNKAKELGCKLLIMDARISTLPKLGHISLASPIEFLQAIRDAEYIIATSFHGTAFSIIFEKQFLTTGLKKNSDRVVSLLSMLGIVENYQVDPIKMINTDYSKLSICLQDKRVYSENLLLQSL